jgi:hypothetical protein
VQLLLYREQDKMSNGSSWRGSTKMKSKFWLVNLPNQL